jgi:hypothetical protein
MAGQKSTTVHPQRCTHCGAVFTPVKLMRRSSGLRYVAHSSGKTCSPACQYGRARSADASRGLKREMNPNWKGGTSHQDLGHRGPNWAKQRSKALKRDGYACVDCSISEEDCCRQFGRSLDVDHVVPFHNFSSYVKANVLSNLACRCASCHRKAEALRSMCQMVLPLSGKKAGGHRGALRGEMANGAKLTRAIVMEIRRSADAGVFIGEISRMFSISTSHACQIVSGKVWRELPLGETHADSRRKKGRRGFAQGEGCGSSRFTEAQVLEMRTRAMLGEKIRAIADRLGETYHAVHLIVSGRGWKHVVPSASTAL